MRWANVHISYNNFLETAFNQILQTLSDMGFFVKPEKAGEAMKTIGLRRC